MATTDNFYRYTGIISIDNFHLINNTVWMTTLPLTALHAALCCLCLASSFHSFQLVARISPNDAKALWLPLAGLGQPLGPADSVIRWPLACVSFSMLADHSSSSLGFLSPPTHLRGGGGYLGVSSTPQSIPIRGGRHSHGHPQQIPQRERSTSAPNVSMNLVNVGDTASLEVGSF